MEQGRLRLVSPLLVLWLSLAVRVLGAESPFAVVFIDGQTEEQLGSFPLDRSIIAKGVEQIKTSKPKAIILKLFFDLPKEPESDDKLAKAFVGIPVVLEARLDDSEKNPNPLPDRFFLNVRPAPSDTTLSGESGWIPLNIFSAKACDVGFVDLISPEKVPILEKYQGRFVKSLYLCALELALGTKAEVFPGEKVAVGGKVIRVDKQNQVPIEIRAKDELDYIRFHDLLSGRTAAKMLQGKVVILGYDGARIHSLETPLGKIRAHRVFFYQLESLYRKLKV